MTTPLTTARSATGTHRRAPVLVGLATLLGLWLGLTAPSVSPVAGPPPQVVSAAPAAAPAAVADDAPGGVSRLVSGLLDAVTPDADPVGRGRGGRR
jgi:hypothetical protein